ncbi:MAG: hypothetical protein E7C76_11160, partial [Pseudomonas aeruginosa]|nr:hypothetical protein [Pseudomonas aeruginosa]
MTQTAITREPVAGRRLKAERLNDLMSKL